MEALLILIVVVVVVGVLWFVVRPRVLQGRERALDSAGAAGTQLGRGAVRGRTAKHRAMLARTVTIEGSADATSGLIGQVMLANERVREVGPGETGALRFELDSGFPKAEAVVGAQHAQLGVTEFVYMLSFPQGGKAWSGVIDAVLTAAADQGLVATEGQQEFVQVDQSGNHDELWYSSERALRQ